ncbi:TetR/AcrR family transcriptional regulator [Roseomonas populi]|uniref:TetR/AcrR family transcriptional regulator n=1 Tax=Roseomonas populi TaxID=3121582 RepID=A0ABT1XAF0_9PROT|nr:TetR/AcrR family transcriptional regulator [Roseomonas pecuniae]MCR0985076.1 TetR/AcrR family transcriptional regulator [Roseomonas pecuniae]
MARYESKRRQIEETAMRLFADRGVDAVSMRDIGAACGISGPGVLSHFGSKDALVAALFAEGYAGYAARIAEAMPAGGPFRERLGAVIVAVLRLHDEDQDRFRFLVLRQHDHLASVQGGDASPVEVIRALVEGAMAAGEIPRRDPDLAALAVIGLVLQPATGRLYGRLTGPLIPLAAEITAMAWGALMAGSEAPAPARPSRRSRSTQR